MHFSRHCRMPVLCLVLSCAVVEAQLTDNKSEESAVRKVLSDINQSWNKHDGVAMAKDYAPDFDHVNVLGRWTHGKDSMEKLYVQHHAPGGMFTGHGTRNSTVQQIRFVRPDVAFAIAESKDEHNHLRTTYVLTKEGSRWLIRSQTVTPVRDPGAGK